MPMQDNQDRLDMRMQARDIILNAGSPILPSQLANGLDTNNHLVGRILSEFEEHHLIEPFEIGKNTEKPLVAWEGTSVLNKINKTKMAEIIEIKKPREKK